MGYKYDLFISYKNQPGLVGWIADHFQPMLQRRLEFELPHQPTIFRDKVSIEAGDEWDPAIREALAKSRLMVAVLTPQYFTSPWCVAEWSAMEAREKLLKDARNKLLIPVKFSNGDSFPGSATQRQFTVTTEFLDVNSTVIPAGSAKAAALEDKVAGLARLLAERLVFAPRFESFPIVDPATVKLPKLPQRKRPTP